MRDVAMVLRRPGPSTMPLTAEGIDNMAAEVQQLEAALKEARRIANEPDLVNADGVVSFAHLVALRSVLASVAS